MTEVGGFALKAFPFKSHTKRNIKQLMLDSILSLAREHGYSHIIAKDNAQLDNVSDLVTHFLASLEQYHQTLKVYSKQKASHETHSLFSIDILEGRMANISSLTQHFNLLMESHHRLLDQLKTQKDERALLLDRNLHSAFKELMYQLAQLTTNIESVMSNISYLNNLNKHMDFIDKKSRILSDIYQVSKKYTDYQVEFRKRFGDALNMWEATELKLDYSLRTAEQK